MFEFRLLGPIEVLRDGAPLPLPGSKQRALLACLLLRAPEMIPDHSLIDAMWAERPPGNARNALQAHVSVLRRTLGAGSGMLVRERAGYALHIEADQLDVRRFVRLYAAGVSAAAAGRTAEAATRLGEALDLWYGAPLDDCDGVFLHEEVEHLDELRLLAFEERVEAQLELGAHAALIPELERHVAAHPFRERPRRQLMLALYRSERQAEALEVYREGRRKLVEELGIEPSPGLRELESMILGQDPSLRAAPFPVDRPPSGGRRRGPATIVCCELSGIADGDRTFDPEVWQRAVERCLKEIRGPVERYGGYLEQFAGGVAVAHFGVERALEDDALRASSAAVDVRDALTLIAASEIEPAIRIDVRIGVASGHVLAAGGMLGSLHAIGAPVQEAVRLARAGEAGEILIDASLSSLLGRAICTEPIERDELRGARLLVTAVPGARVGPFRVDSTFVGREQELAALRSAFDDTLTSRRCRLITLLGAPGIGKSRLVEQLLAELPGPRIARGRCPHYGDGLTFWPLAEAVRGATGAHDDDPSETLLSGLELLLSGERRGEHAALILLETIGLADPIHGGDERGWATLRLLEALTRTGPLVMVFEDVHWAEAQFLELLAFAAAHADRPVLIVCTARPERERAPSAFWQGSEVLPVEPLSVRESERLVASVGAELSAVAQARVVRAAAGNPLFAEELAAMPAQAVGQRVPATIEALLAAQLDRLAATERAVLERGSIEGEVFHLGGILHLGGGSESSTRDAAYELVRTGVLRPAPATVRGEEAFAFRHVLLRDAAYALMSLELRAELHESFAGWVAQVLARQAVEELVGYHLEASYRLRKELEAIGEPERALARRAGDLLATAGVRADDRDDFHGSATLLLRALALLDSDDPRRVRLGSRATHNLAWSGQTERAIALASSELNAATTRGARSTELYWTLSRDWLDGFAGRRRIADTGRLAADVLPQLKRAGDDTMIIDAHTMIGWAAYTAGQMTRFVEAYDHARARAVRAGHRRAESHTLAFLALGFLRGPWPVPEAIRRCEELLDTVGARRQPQANALAALAELAAAQSRFADARELYRRSQAILEPVGLVRAVAVLAYHGARVEELAGDVAASELQLRRGYDGFLLIGELRRAAVLAARLSIIILEQGRISEAEPLADAARETALPEDAPAQIAWREATARLLARRGDLGRAIPLARDAARRAARTDEPVLLGKAQETLAHVLVVAERHAEAAHALGEAIRQYEEKEHLVLSSRASAALQALHHVTGDETAGHFT